MKYNILVIGGSGFLGSHVADALTNDGQKVTVIDKEKSQWLDNKQLFFKANIEKPETFLHLIKKSDYIFNFAAISDLGEANKNPIKTVEVNILGLVKLLEFCVKFKIKKYIHASTVYVSGDHGGFYKSSKLSAESFVKEYFKIKKLKYCILRYGTLYGPRSDINNGLYKIITNALKKNKIIYSGSKESIRDYIHVIDAARASLKGILKEFENKTIIISGPESRKIKDILKIISEITGIKKIQYVKKDDVKIHSHYLKTPYNVKNLTSAFSMKYSDNYQIDLGQGIKNLVQDLKNKKN